MFVTGGQAKCSLAGLVPYGCSPGTGSLDGYTCEACPKGLYQDGTSFQPATGKMLPGCKACPAPTTTSGTGSASCDLCVDGYGGGSSGTCSHCTPGSFGRGLTITQPCQACSGPTQFTNNPGSTACFPCPANQVANSADTDCVCMDGYGGSPSGSCIQCAPGFAGQGLTSTQPCTPCSGANDYTDTPGRASCLSCPSSQVANAAHTGCVSSMCPVGSGGGSSGVCSPCPVGYYGPPGLLVTQPCVACSSSSECTDTPGSATCLTCPSGLEANSGHTGCVGE